MAFDVSDLLLAIKNTERDFLRQYPNPSAAFGDSYPLIQRQLFNHNLRSVGLSEQQSSKKVQLKFLANALISELLDQQTDKVSKRDIAFLFPTTGRRFKVDGKWIDSVREPFMGSSIASEQQWTSFQFELPAFGTYKLPKYDKSLFIGLSEVKFRIFKKFAPIDPLSNTTEFQFFKQVAHANGLDVSPLQVKAWSQIKHYMLKRTAAFKRQLMIIKPKFAITYPWYGTVNMAFVKAAHELQIPTVDVQHGIQGRYHAAYTAWPEFCLDSNYFPSNFFVWRQEDKDWLDSWVSHRQKVYVSGVPAHQIAGAVLESDQYLKSIQSRFKETFAALPKVLVTLQPKGNSFLDWLVSILKNPVSSQFNWIVRAHPGDQSALAHIAEALSPFRHVALVEDATFVPLVHLLKLADIHITDYSSVVQEAALMQVPSLFTNRNAVYFDAETKSGIATQIPMDDRLIHNIRSILENKKSDTSASRPESLGSALYSLITATNVEVVDL